MKKNLYFASALLTASMVTSCAMYDNPIDDPTVVIVDENGNKYETDLIATLKGEIGAEVTLGIGVYDGYDIYGVDFGDGNIVVDTVCWHNGGARELGAAEGETPAELPGTTHTYITSFKGTVAGEGIVKVYGKSDVWYLSAAGGIIPTSFDQEKLKNVVQLQVNGYNTEKMELPELEKLEQFTCNQSPVKTVDVSKCVALRTLSVCNNSMSKYPTQLENIDLSKNVNLEDVRLQGYAASPGKLKKLDLSNNPKMTGMGLYVQFNELEELIIGENTLTTINVMNNKLTSLDLTKFPKLKSLYANDNQLTELDFSQLQAKGTLNINNNQLTELNIPVAVAALNASGNKLTKVTLTDCTSSCNLENNCLTIATLPTKPAGLNTASKIKKFLYNNQADMEVALEGAVLDLSAQASAQGELEAPVATTFTVKAGEATLEAGKDYTIENGKITFLKSATGVVVEMTTEAFPKLTALKTKAFDVTVGGGADANIWKAAAAEEIAGGTTIVDNDFAKIVTVFSAKANADAKTICGVPFDAALLVRSKTAISADNLNGTENGNNSTPLIYTAKKNATIKIYYNRQTGDGFVAGDGKDIKVIDQANPAEKSALSGTITFDETLTDTSASYGLVMKTYQVEAGHVYTIYGRGTTISCYGIAFE